MKAVMMWTLAFVIMLYTLKETYAEPPVCYTDLYFMYKCDLKLNKISLPGDFTELDRFCRKLEFYYFCYHYYYVDFPEDLLCGWTLIFDRVEPVIVKLCTKGDEFRESYLNHSHCLKTMEFDKCDKYSTGVYDYYLKKLPQNSLLDHQGLRPFVLEDTDRNEDEGQRLKSCIVATSKLYCFAEFIMKICGLEGGLLYGQLISSSDPLSVVCNEPDILPSRDVYERVVKELQHSSPQELDDLMSLSKS